MKLREGGKMRRIKTTFMILVAVSIVMVQHSSAQGLEKEDYSFQTKSASKASFYSQLATAVPVTLGAFSALTDDMGTSQLALISSGLIVGPSIGYFYGGCAKRGIAGALVRFGTGAFALFVINSIEKKDDGEEDSYGMNMDINMGKAVGGVAALLGLTVVVIQSIYDISKVGETVEERNDELLTLYGMNVSLSPRYFADSGAGGLELNITF
jgi:hypothetical protein